MKYTDTDRLDVMLGNLSRDCEKAGIDAQKAGAKVVEKAVVSRLNGIRTKDKKTENTIKHMADDVTINTTKDTFGDTVIRVRGGKKTGTLWHIVNDGTYRSKPTHFMDLALGGVESELNALIDEKLKKVFK